MLKLSSQKAEPTSPRGSSHHTSCPSLRPWTILQRPLEPYEPRQTKTIPKCHVLLWFALWITLCSTPKQMSRIINSNRRELRCASIPDAFLQEGHYGTACNTDRHRFTVERGRGRRKEPLPGSGGVNQSKVHSIQRNCLPSPCKHGKPELASATLGSSAAVELGSKLSALQKFDFVLT